MIRTNTELLEAKIAQSGLKKTYLAEKVGLSLAGFRNCCTNRAEFKANQIQILCKELNITSLREKEAIFFCGRWCIGCTGKEDTHEND